MSSQQKYLSPEDVKSEWQDYTSFQRQELVNFATFLYDEEFYERALLVYFQFLYKYPGDELEMAAYFKIGKCYEMMENWDLAENYYNRIIAKAPEGMPPVGSGWKSEKLVIELGVFNDLPNISIFLVIRDSSFIFTQS